MPESYILILIFPGQNVEARSCDLCLPPFGWWGWSVGVGADAVQRMIVFIGANTYLPNYLS